jgi:Cd2+/Zn2+-exporting ATPase
MKAVCSCRQAKAPLSNDCYHFRILSIIGIHLYAPWTFIFAAFIIAGIGHEFNKWNKSTKLKFSSINLLMTIAVIAAFYLGERMKRKAVVLYVLGEFED